MQQHRYFCDRCGRELDYTTEASVPNDKNIAWPKGYFNVSMKVKEICKKCATKLAKENFTGSLLNEVLESIKEGGHCPLP